MRNTTIPCLFLAAAGSLFAQPPALEMNVVYTCQPPFAIKLLSCTGKGPTDTCDVQSFNAGRAFQRGRSTYPQVMGLLPTCHRQTPAEAQAMAKVASMPAPAAASSAAGPAAGPGGFKVGDRVRVLISGWEPAQILQIHGNFYVVRLTSGIEVSKQWPFEVHREGKLTAEDHAAGQYESHDRVQVNINGRWADGEIVGQNNNMYTIKVPGYRGAFDSDTVDTTPNNIRISTSPAPAGPAQRTAGQPPKPGFVSCGGKYDGRWESTSGMAGNQFIFRSGKANVTEGVQNLGSFDCFLGGGKISLYRAGSFKAEEELDINNDGTLQTQLGAIKKMGN